MWKKLAILLGIFLFLGIFTHSVAASSVSRSFKDAVAPNKQFTIFLSVELTKNEQYYLIDEMYPIGFKIISSDTGSMEQEGHVRWGLIGGARSTTLSYKLQAPSIKGNYDFRGGQYIFEGEPAASDIVGQATIKVDPAASDTKCLDKCENDILYLKGTFDPFLGCIYQSETLCKYGCDYAAKSIPPPCKLFPDTPPAPNSTDYSDTIWTMVKAILDSKNDTTNIDLLNQTFKKVSAMSQKGSMKTFGTEYVLGQNGTLFLKLLDSNELPINSGFCSISMYYPNKTIKFMDNSPTTFLENGLYYKDFFVPTIEGLYIADANCIYADTVFRYNIPSEDCGYDGNIAGGTSPQPLTFSNVDCVGFQTTAGGTYQNFTYNYTSIGLINLSAISQIDVNWVGQVGAANAVIQIWDWNASVWDSLGTALASTGITLSCGNNVYITRVRSQNFTSYARNNTIKTRIFRSGTASIITDSMEVVLHNNGSVVASLRGSSEVHVNNFFNQTTNLTVNMNQTQLNSILTAIASVNQTLNTTVLNYLVMINGTIFNINGSEYNSLLSAINSVNTTATANQNLLTALNISLANLTISELSHYNSLIAFLASINTTLNTTLEYKLDLINGTVMQINQTTFNTLQQVVSMNNTFTQYLVVINGTAIQINSSQFLYYTNLLAAINSVNQTLNTTILNYLIGINGTVYNTNQQIPLILQYLHDINVTTNTTIPASLISINNTQNQHFVEIMNFLASINYTANTTLELKLDQINMTVVQINNTVNQINTTTGNITIDLQPVLNAIASVNNTLNTTILNLLNQINTTTMQNQNYLLVINGTVFQINDSILGIINQINNVNNTQNSNYLSLYNLLVQINQTSNTTLELVASINQSLLSDYISLYNLLLSVNGTVQNLNASEYQHFQELFVILTDINYTTNTTLENKLDLINYTTWQTWVMLQNLTIGNVSVTANVNWSEGIPYIWNASSPYVINNKLISLSDEGIQLVTETLTCISNTTLQHFINATNCLQGICNDYTKTIPEICNWGCKNNQCLPAPQYQYFFAFGFILLLVSAIFMAWRANK